MASLINADTSDGLKFTSDTSGEIKLQSAGTDTVTVKSSGNVGIGTSSPNSKTEIVGRLSLTDGGGASRYALNIESNNSGVGYTSINAYNYATSSGTNLVLNESGGNLLVGTTSNASSAAKIMVSSTAPQMAINGNGAGVNSLINWTTSGTTKAQTYFDATNTRFYIACNNSGGVYLASGGTSWTSASDERVKDIIEPIENATEKLGGWRAVIGKYKTDADGTRRSFLIAQDVIQTFPEAVDATNEEELGVSYTDTIPLLVKAIQEQQETITALETRIQALENA